MNYRLITTSIAAAALTSAIGFAQTEPTAAASDFKPATSNQPGREYPQVNSEGRVRARVVAPDAHTVLLDIGAVKYPMTKGADGAWIGDSNPQDEGFHYYQLVIDGAQVPDPGSLYFYGASRWGSGVEVPAKDQDFYALKNVPHGQIREHLYFSKSNNAMRRCFVYTPPGYDADPTKRYPVLYLQHGGGEDETGWPSQGRTNLIMDNLIAEGKAMPFIIVMDNGTWRMPGQARPAAPPRRDERPQGPWPPAGWADGFKKTLLEDVIPMIDASYRTLADQRHRGDGRAVDGRHADQGHHPGQPGHVLARRHLQRRQHQPGGRRRPRRPSRTRSSSCSSASAAVSSRTAIARGARASAAIPRRTPARSRTPGSTPTSTSRRTPRTSGRPGGAACTSSPSSPSKTSCPTQRVGACS